MTAQLNFDLKPQSPHSLRYFVVHTGASEAVQTIQLALKSVAENPSTFKLVLLHGATGSGKTHLLEGAAEEGIAIGIPAEKISVIDVRELRSLETGKIEASALASFIDRYEQLRASGGLLLLEANDVPTAANGWDPHLWSRLVAGYIVRLGYPREDELRPLLSSLVERKNLKLSENSLNYLLKWLPADPLSFDRILSAINDLSFSSKRSAGQRLIQEVVRESR